MSRGQREKSGKKWEARKVVKEVSIYLPTHTPPPFSTLYLLLFYFLRL
jgi:hypothetical protein